MCGGGGTFRLNISESQYGSWTKLSLISDFPTPTSSAQGSSTQGSSKDVSPEDTSEEEDETVSQETMERPPVSSCTQLLTQPPSTEQESLLSKRLCWDPSV